MKLPLLLTSTIFTLITSTPAISGCVGTVVMGECSGTEIDGVSEYNSNSYESSSGTRYEYDLNNPGGKIGYSHDYDAQRRDQMSSNPNRRLDQRSGQYGGGIYD